jgi:MFS family permease
MVTSIWCAVAVSFESFEAARIVNGIFSQVAQAGGLMWIKDLFFFHEHPRKINIWSGGVILSPYLGPLTAAFIIWHTTWRWAYGIYAILNGVGLLLSWPSPTKRSTTEAFLKVSNRHGDRA